MDIEMVLGTFAHTVVAGLVSVFCIMAVLYIVGNR